MCMHSYVGGSKKVGSLKVGTVVEVLEKSVNSRGQARLKIAAGWLSLVAGDGTVLLEDVKTDRPARLGIIPHDQVDRSEREDLAADMTAWLLDHPNGDLSGWIAESEWVKNLGSSVYGPCTASRSWPEIFAEQQRQMRLLPVTGEERPPPSDEFDELRMLGRQWAMSSVMDDEESALHEPLTAPAIISEEDMDDGHFERPATWSDVRDVANAAKAQASGIPPKSAVVSTVSSPQSDVAPSPVVDEALNLSWGSARSLGVDNVREKDRDEDEDDTGEWTYVESSLDADSSAWTPSASDMNEDLRMHGTAAEWEIVNTE